jgi:outer membrane biogenesis lipoprotein LolB
MTAPGLPTLALAAAALAACLLGGCTAPAPAGAERGVVNQQKQSELSEMEKIGQRNDDRAPIK